MKYIVHTDGGARGNPGPAGIGVVIERIEGNKPIGILSYGTYIGEATNNVAEYKAVKNALETIISKHLNKKENTYQFFLDSLLVVNQLNGMFKVKDATLRELLSRIRILEEQVRGVITYSHVARSENMKADLEVNKALDIFLFA